MCGWAVRFADCNGETLSVGDIVTLEGRKRRASVVKLHTTGDLKGLVTLDPPLRHKEHWPDELDIVRHAADVVPIQQNNDMILAFNEWLKATNGACDVPDGAYTVSDVLDGVGNPDCHR